MINPEKILLTLKLNSSAESFSGVFHFISDSFSIELSSVWLAFYKARPM